MPQKLCIFLTGGSYAPYATCMARPLAAAVDVVYRRPIGAVVTVQRVRRRLQMARLDSTISHATGYDNFIWIRYRSRTRTL